MKSRINSKLDATLTRPHFSCKVYTSYLTFLRKNYPRINLESVCEEAGLSLNYLEDENNFVSVIFDEVFTRICKEKTRQDDLCFQVGAQSLSAEVLGKIVHFLVSNTLSIETIYEQVPRLTSVYSKVTKVEILNRGAKRIRFRLSAVTDELDDAEKRALRSNFPNIFQNTLGHYTAIPTTHNLPPAHANYIELKGANDFPIYEITIDYERSSPWKRVAYFLLPLATAIALSSFIVLQEQVSLWDLTGLCLVQGILWIITGRYYFLNLKDQFDQALTAVQNADQRYASLQNAQHELQKLSESYKKFVPWEFIDLLQLKDITELGLGQSLEKEMTVMFLDLRGFSKMAEQMSAKQSFMFLNDVLANIAPVIREYDGFIDKYIGDGLMAIFPKSSGKALEAGLAILRKLSTYNLKRHNAGLPEIKIGIGINCGKVTLGTIGYKDQMQNTAISDVVNTAARLEQATKLFGVSIVASEEAIEQSGLKDEIGRRYLGRITPEGKSNPISCFEIYEASQFHLFSETAKPFDDAVRYYESKNFGKALEKFEEVLIRSPHDQAALKYLKLITELILSEKRVNEE